MADNFNDKDMSWKTNKGTGKKFQSKGRGVDNKTLDSLNQKDFARVTVDAGRSATMAVKDYFVGMESASDHAKNELKPKLAEIAEWNLNNRAGKVDEYPRKEIIGTLEWILRNMELEVENEDWNSDVKQGNLESLKEFNKIMNRVHEGAKYWIDTAFGYGEEPNSWVLENFSRKDRSAWRKAGYGAVMRVMSQYRKDMKKQLRTAGLYQELLI